MKRKAVSFKLVSTASFSWFLAAMLIAIRPAIGVAMIPQGFVYLSTHCPGIVISANYATTENFTGEVVAGYRRVESVFSKKGADALCRVQARALALGFSLKIFDAYRPVKAVTFFQEWAQRPGDVLELKERYYPNYTKLELFERGYIAKQSSHSRGSAVDLTLVDANGNEVDMGGIFDFFHERSHTASPDITPEQRRHRELLKTMMEAEGFKNFGQEWWHYSLRVEAFPGQSFDFDIE
jgi:D-alanyl-D-alanine dipeptidase